MEITPDLLSTIFHFVLYGFAILAAGMTITAVAFFLKQDADSIKALSVVIDRFEILKFVTVLLIIVSVTLLGLLAIIKGESVAAILSAIAGYVLGSVGPRGGAKREAGADKPLTE